MPNGKATIDTDGFELLVRFSFDPKVTSEIKARIPGAYRRWDEEEKAWRVSKLYADTLFDILDESLFATRDFTGKDRAALVRQNEHAFRRKQRIRKRDEAEDTKRQRWHAREQDKEERRETAEEARRRAHQEQEDVFADGIYVDAGPEEYAYWRKRFAWANPALRNVDFVIWWDYFTKYGSNAAANAAFKAHTKKQKRRTYGHYTYDEDRDGDFTSWYKKYFGGGQNNSNSGTKTVDPYTVLGIVRGCSKQEAQRAYLTLAQQYHPSSSYTERTPDENKMKEINNARDEIWREREW